MTGPARGDGTGGAAGVGCGAAVGRAGDGTAGCGGCGANVAGPRGDGAAGAGGCGANVVGPRGDGAAGVDTGAWAGNGATSGAIEYGCCDTGAAAACDGCQRAGAAFEAFRKVTGGID